MLTGNELAKVGSKPGLITQELMDKRKQFISRGIANVFPIVIEEAKGAVIKDIDGNHFIDFYGGIGVLNAGHCPETVVDAIKNQADKLIHSCFITAMYDSYINLAEKIAKMAPGSSPKKVFFMNSGSEAVENAVKAAKAYTKKPGVICFDSAFHGRTLLTISLTSKVKPYKAGFGPFAPEIYRVPSAYCYRCAFEASYPGCAMKCLKYFDKFFKADVDPENIGAMIIEPVQGEGGFIVPPPEYLPGLKEICEKHGIVFIADEVQTGFCRTGKMFAVEHFNVEPDIMTIAKSMGSGMPLSGIVGKAEIMDALEPNYVGGTYGGNPLSCMASLAVIDVMEQNDLSQKATEIGNVIITRLKKLQNKYFQIGDIRSLGAMIGVELVKDPITKEPAVELCAQIRKESFNRGLLILGAGVYDNVIRILVPLVVTKDQLNQSLSIFEDSCNICFSK